jgi:hypothetical protein
VQLRLLLGALLAAQAGCDRGNAASSASAAGSQAAHPASSLTLADPGRIPAPPEAPRAHASSEPEPRRTDAGVAVGAVEVVSAYGDDAYRARLAADYRRCWAKTLEHEPPGTAVAGSVELVVSRPKPSADAEVRADHAQGVPGVLVSCAKGRTMAEDWSGVGAAERIRILIRFGPRD